MDIPILFEDDALLVINKPSGVVVNRAESVKNLTVQDWVETHFSSFWQASQRARPESDPGQARMTTQDDFIRRSGIVHRIDKETSGILLIAKTPEAFAELQRQFKERLVHKTYLAIVHGKVVPEEGEIKAPIGRLPWNTEHFGVVPGGKEAVTKYKVLRALKGLTLPGKVRPFYTLVELYPETGRTHQIRVHLKYINHPIVGDYLYAGRVVSRNDRVWAPRVMLHAWKISFTHPNVKQNACLPAGRLAFEAPIPDDMERIINHKTQ